MKQKYLILNDPDNRLIKIQEFAELNKEMLSLLCEEEYAYQAIQSAIAAGSDAVIAALRTNNMYPPGIYAEHIASAVTNLFQSGKSDSIELFFDDVTLLTGDRDGVRVTEQTVDESAEPDDVLEDSYDESYTGKDGIKKIDSSLKIADDNSSETEDGN
jgi:hypothetical protein